MKKEIKPLWMIVVTFLIVSAQGCATIVSGKKQEMTFNSEPEGATVTVSGRVLGKTPMTLQLDKKTDQSVTFEKEGYKSQTMQLTTTIDGWFWGNIVIGGLFGSTTDAVTGAVHEYAPSQYYVTLAPDTNSPVREWGSDKAKAKEFIVASYTNIIEDLSRGEGDYLLSLLSLLKVSAGNKSEAIKKIRALSEVYTVIPDFAEQVSNYYLK